MGCGFYYENGDQICTIDKFIEVYSGQYFIQLNGVERKTETRVNDANSRPVGQSSKYVENRIVKLLDQKKFTKHDVALILAWKMGKIKHLESEREKKIIVYGGEWEDQLGEYCENEHVFAILKDTPKDTPFKIYGGKTKIYLEEIAGFMSDNYEHVNKLLSKENGICKSIELMKSRNWAGIGPVYMITLLYFMANKKNRNVCPIYDRFAMRALLAIHGDKKPRIDVIECKDLPDRKSNSLGEAVQKRMKYYTDKINKLKTLDGYKKNYGNDERALDQALWVYGHLFPGNEKSSC